MSIALPLSFQVTPPSPAQPIRPARRKPSLDRRWVFGVLLGVPVLAAVMLQLRSFFPTASIVVPPRPTTVTRVVLEAVPEGTALSLVLADELGRDVAMTGHLTFELREPDGAAWRSERTVQMQHFQSLPAPSLLEGRLGYRLVIPNAAWVRPPRHGGQASIFVNVEPQDVPPFTAVFSETFP